MSMLVCFGPGDILEHCKIYLSIDPNNDGIAVKFYKKSIQKLHNFFDNKSPDFT